MLTCCLNFDVYGQMYFYVPITILKFKVKFNAIQYIVLCIFQESSEDVSKTQEILPDSKFDLSSINILDNIVNDFDYGTTVASTSTDKEAKTTRFIRSTTISKKSATESAYNDLATTVDSSAIDSASTAALLAAALSLKSSATTEMPIMSITKKPQKPSGLGSGSLSSFFSSFTIRD